MRMRRRFGGGLYCRPSLYVSWLPHFGWMPYVGCSADEILAYVPSHPTWGYDAPWFRGHVLSEAEELALFERRKARREIDRIRRRMNNERRLILALLVAAVGALSALLFLTGGKP